MVCTVLFTVCCTLFTCCLAIDSGGADVTEEPAHDPDTVHLLLPSAPPGGLCYII